MRVLSCLATEHDLRLVALAAFICVSGCWVGFDLIQRARDRSGKQRNGWIFLAAVATGSSIWCTHFIAMLAFKPGVPIAFDPTMTLASLLIAIAGCGFGIYTALQASPKAAIIGGGLIGLSISAMHYTGMAAYSINGLAKWDTPHIVASVVLAAALASAALHTYLRRPWPYSNNVSLGIFVLAIVSLHFTGMAALSIAPIDIDATPTDTTILNAIAVAIAGVGLIVAGTGVASHLIDSEASYESVRQLLDLSLNDALTQLPNRVTFHNTLSDVMARAEVTGRKVAVLGIDLDRFKEINDLRGHEAGDVTLKLIAARLKGFLTDGEHAARTGGDEFACLKLYSEHADLLDFVARVERALHKPFSVDGAEIAPRASIGVAIYPTDSDVQERLISNADLALHRAKADTSRSVCYYEASMDEASRERRNLAIDLRSAIDNGEFHLHFQVQKQIGSGTISGYEVLLRWTHPVRGSVPPSTFIPVAEEAGSILQIGHWVMKTACAEAARWHEPHKIAVNVSPAQLTAADFTDQVAAILKDTCLDPSRLEIEITESAIIHDKVRALKQLCALQALGVTIAIDDFGTGYSSLDTLRSFPFNKIKLDRSFMQDIGHNQQATAIVRAVLALGKSLDIPVLAEGVETAEQLLTLKLEGCNEAQGYLLGMPGSDVEGAAPPLVAADAA